MLIDHVYRTVQILLNKNSRGTLTPERFNELARMAMNNFFINLVDEKRRYMNRKSARKGGMRKQEVDKAMARYLKVYRPPNAWGAGSLLSFDIPDDFALFPDSYLFRVLLADKSMVEIPEIPIDSFTAYQASIVKPSNVYPQHSVMGGVITIHPPLPNIYSLSLHYYRKPHTPNWTYAVQNNVPVFNPSDPSFQDLDIYEHRSEELINEIALLAGLSLKDQLSVQVSAALKQEDTQTKDSL